MKDLYTKLMQRQGDTDGPRNQLLHPNLYRLGYSVSLSVNHAQPRKVTNFESSVYESIFEDDKSILKEVLLHCQCITLWFMSQLSSIEVTIDLQEPVISNPRDSRVRYDQLALYRYADSATEWLPCRVLFKYMRNEVQQSPGVRGLEGVRYEDISGFGVQFERFQGGRPSVVLIRNT